MQFFHSHTSSEFKFWKKVLNRFGIRLSAYTVTFFVTKTMSISLPRNRRRGVIVLGAGMSGLACARELRQRHHYVLVVEARGRVGGRLKGAPLLMADGTEQPVDLGGALIHGVDENPLQEITQELGVETRAVQDCLLMDNSGWPVDPREDEKVSIAFNECLDECFQHIKEDGSPNKKARGGLDASKASFDDIFRLVCTEKGLSADKALMAWHQANLEVSCGKGFDGLGWEWNEDEPYGFDGEHTALAPSWKAVVDDMATKLDVLHRAVVKSVNVVHPMPEKEETGSAPKAKASGDSARPKRAVREKAKHLDEEAVTPERQSRRIRGQEAGVRRSSRSNKTVQRFEVVHETGSSQRKRSRPKGSRSYSYVQVTIEYEGNTLVLEADAVVCTLPLAVLQLPPSSPEGISFNPPLPTEKTDALSRLGAGLLNKCALSFSHVFWQESDFLGLADTEEDSYLVLNVACYTGGKPILLFMFGGNTAHDIEKWTDEEIVSDCLKVLKRICGRRTVPHPVDYHVTRWGHERYSHMAFTYIPPGVDGLTDLSTVSQPIYDHDGKRPVLMFAGEHTTPYHPSTIHGAFLSGIREAYRYDTSVDPDSYDDFDFAEDNIYEYTFQLGSAPKEDTKKSAVSKQAKGHAQRRHRGASGVMTRRRPSLQTTSKKTQQRTLSPDPTSVVSPTRKSHRASAGVKKSLPSDDEVESKDDTIDEKTIRAQENRSVKRGVESYGDDADFMEHYVVPVYGSTSDKAISNIQKRCASLLRNSLRTPKRVSAADMKWWTARNAIPTSEPLHKRRSLRSLG